MSSQPKFDARTGYDPNAVVRSDLVEISAPASVVWGILIDLEHYGERNPFCVTRAFDPADGCTSTHDLVDYTSPGRLVANVEYVCAFEPEKRISWALYWSEEWPYAARRDQIIEALGPARCRYHSTDAFLGDTGIHVMRFAGAWLTRAFNDSARALKLRAEALYRAAQK